MSILNPYTMKTLYPARLVRAGQVLALALLLPMVSSGAPVPLSFTLTVNQVHENNPAGTVVGHFIEEDALGACTYSLVSGQDDADNSAFNISGNELSANKMFDFETVQTAVIRVRCTDIDGSYTEQTFVILIIDVHEAPNALDANNIVTPNGDGRNDTWKIRNLPVHANNQLRIFDRSGRTVYVARNYQHDWDGRMGNGQLLAEGVYYYVMDMGPSYPVFKGSITLIRDRR